MNSALIFGLLIALMLTGMPISIALGLTVLSFLYVMTQVPIEAVALKLFTGIESFEIMAIPFFILAGNFLTHGGVARRMIRFATTMVGHWYGGLGLAAVMACAALEGAGRALDHDLARLQDRAPKGWPALAVRAPALFRHGGTGMEGYVRNLWLSRQTQDLPRACSDGGQGSSLPHHNQPPSQFR